MFRSPKCQLVIAFLLISPLAGWTELGYSNRVLRVRLTRQKLVIVPVRINGQGPYNFLWDTGTPVTVIRPELVARLQGKAIGSSLFLAGLRTHKVTWYQFESIGPEGAEIGPVEVIGFSLDNHRDLSLDGILGQDILHHFNYLLDYRKKVIVIDEDKSLAASLSSTKVSLVEAKDRLVVTVTPHSNKKKSSLFILDSGANCLVVFKENYEDYGLDVLLRDGTEVQTAGGVSLEKTGRVRSFRIGNKEMNDVAVVFVPVTPYTVNRPEFGTLPLKWFDSVYFNHSQKLVAFEPQFNLPVGSQAKLGKTE